MKSSQVNNKADHILYRVYWRLILSDILTKQGFNDDAESKKVLHEFHKRILGYKSIADQSEEIVSEFINKVVLFWAEQGIFVRTSKRQPFWIEKMDLADCWELL